MITGRGSSQPRSSSLGCHQGILAHGRSFFHRAIEQGLAVAAAGRSGSAGRSLPLKENHDLRGAHGPHTRHRDAADDPPALGRIAIERALQALWTELAAPPAVFLRQHLIFHELSTSLKRPANGDFYGIPTRTRANVKHQLAGECQALPGTGQRTRSNGFRLVPRCPVERPVTGCVVTPSSRVSASAAGGRRRATLPRRAPVPPKRRNDRPCPPH